MSAGKTHFLAKELQKLGCSVRQSQHLVNTFFNAIKEGLTKGDQIDLPFGSFKVIPQWVKPYRRWRFGQPQTAYARQNRVMFIPKEDLLNEIV